MNSWRIRFERPLTAAFRIWWRFHRPMTLGVRGIACDERGHVLLVRHTYSAGWYLPGGGVEHGERAPDAIIREMAEEGGVEAAGAPTLLGFYSNHANYRNDHVALYRIEHWRPCIPTATAEIAERGFFPPQAPPPETTQATVRRLDEIFAGAPASLDW
ncbi:MAG: NUDIX domain-containing protein [Hyphomonadaceae bacterium]